MAKQDQMRLGTSLRVEEGGGVAEWEEEEEEEEAADGGTNPLLSLKSK